ncbi:hypothetical protein WAK64_14515 [Bacillus spongiae]|uniref:Uncharacterized protein n=1 Tax=Bacillus spongiae TaxID=2683610 RepID=A0ABU8HGL7_9BACI
MLRLKKKRRKSILILPKAQQVLVSMWTIFKHSQLKDIFRNEVCWEEGFTLASKAKGIVEEKTIAQGLIKKAEEHPEKSLTNLLKQLGYSVTVSFKEVAI